MIYTFGSKNRRAFYEISDTRLSCFNEHEPDFGVPISHFEYKTKQFLMAVISNYGM
jgi:hypothetical protein